jgi:hypothetical protein
VRRVLGTEVGEYLPALGLLLLTLGYLWIGHGYKPAVRAFPVGVAWVMVGLLALDLISRSATRPGRALLRWLNPAAGADQQPRPAARQVAAVLWVAGFAALLMLVGILDAVPLFVFASLRFRARRGWGACVLGAAGATFFVWVLFSVLLRLSLYPGLLFGGD